jgi:hypothetical protein
MSYVTRRMVPYATGKLGPPVIAAPSPFPEFSDVRSPVVPARRQVLIGALVPPVQQWKGNYILYGSRLPIALPPYNMAMDPSDPRTWRRPVRFT